VGLGDPWRGLFLQDYARERPPYVDLGAAKGIWVSSWTPHSGGQLRGPVHRPQLRRLPGPPVRAAPGRARPGRRELDRFLGGDGDPTPLEPGEERAVFKASDGPWSVEDAVEVTALEA
jgi:hypothetical protein